MIRSLISLLHHSARFGCNRRSELTGLLAAVLALPAAGTAKAEVVRIESPSRVVEVVFENTNGVSTYRINRLNRPVVETSRMGFRLANGRSLNADLVIKSSELLPTVDHTWTQVWGEQKEIRDHHKAAQIELAAAKDQPALLRIEFRVFDDGVGFRYEILDQPGIASIEIADELTEFVLPADHRTWWIPAFEGNRYEYHYTDSRLSQCIRVHTPVTMETRDGLYLSIHEAALTDFASMALKRSDDHTLEADLVPWSDGIKVRGKLPMQSPWRTIQFADTPGGLIENYLVLNLNEPNRLDDVSWIQPGKYVGIWWGMHIRKYTWHPGPRHGATTENTKRYIDFAGEHGIDGVLVEGWNLGWDGDWVADGHKFDFTTPYPDYDLTLLADYARKRGVRLIGHHETGAAVENYERQMEDAFALCKKLDIRAVKTGYVGHGQNIKRTGDDGRVHREWHHGQYMARHYRKVVETAAKYQVMLDVHEPIKDTGIRRTYPNMMTREGACGQEFNAWGGKHRNPPDHTTILPFTRMLAGPMDFTPGIFDLHFDKHQSGNRVSTTLAKQLALYVVIYSPLQMAADLPENYEEKPRLFQFIKDVPTDWEYTRVLHGRIGDYVTIARKDRNSDDWFLGSITDEHPRLLDANLSFLDPNKTYTAQIYRDGDDADWKTKPYATRIETRTVKSMDHLPLRLAPGGGTAIRFAVRQESD